MNLLPKKSTRAPKVSNKTAKSQAILDMKAEKSIERVYLPYEATIRRQFLIKTEES